MKVGVMVVGEGKMEGDANEWLAGIKGGESHTTGEEGHGHIPIIG
jgi:hypothetical protein